MKFQKTLLAAALAVVGFGAQAATEANVTKYVANGTEYLVVDEIVSGKGDSLLEVNQWYKITNGQITKTEEPKGDLQKVAAGMVKYESKGNGTSTSATTEDKNSFKDNVKQNDYWSVVTESTTSSTAGKESDFTLKGQLVNATENGNTSNVHESFDVLYEGKVIGETNTSVIHAKKDIQVGNLTQVATGSNTDGLAKYDFSIVKNNAQGSLATIKELNSQNTSVAAVTGNGLAVLNVPNDPKAIVDLEKGTVTFTKSSGDVVKEKNISLTSYEAGTDEVIKVGTGADAKYYLASKDALNEKNTVLTEYKGDTSKLKQTGYGLADKESGGKTVTSTNTGLVSHQNVTYGESVTQQDNAGIFTIASTDPDKATEISGGSYTIDTTVSKTTSSKNVVTGIIAEDEKGNKTYGLQATNVVDNKVTGQTTITADGISTTGDVTIFAGSDKQTTVGSFVESAAAAVEAKVGAALEQVDVRLQEFNSTASRLNQRISDVEETAYRGVAIALAAQQQIPNIGAGQTAVFGGVGHYEGESAAALGLATVLADGRTSFSGALGVAGDGEIGGRVGVAYVFGGK